MESPQRNAIRETDFDGVHTAIRDQSDFTSGLSAPCCPKLRLGKQLRHRVLPVNESILLLNCQMVQLLGRVKPKPQDKRNRTTNPCASSEAVKLSYRSGAK